jgi:aryl-alcohol dehydrogenase-like predicted oxidoreductase
MSEASELAQRFHETYERLAPSFGYSTREASAKPWAEVPENNRQLMTAVCAEILASRPVPVEDAELVERMRREGKKLREAEANLKGVVTMRLESAKWLADDFDEAAARLTALSAENAALSARNAVVETIAERAIAAVADAEREADWNIPTFGPTTSEQLASELAALTTKETDDGE